MGWFSFSKKKNQSGKKSSSANQHEAQGRSGDSRQPAGNQGADNMFNDFVILELPNSAVNTIMREEPKKDNESVPKDSDGLVGDSNGLITNQKKPSKDSSVLNADNIDNDNKENIDNEEHDNIINENRPPVRKVPESELDENGLPMVPDIKPAPQYPKYSLAMDKSTAILEDDKAIDGRKKKVKKAAKVQVRNNLIDDDSDDDMRIEGLNQIEAREAENKKPENEGFPGFVPDARRRDDAGLAQRVKNTAAYLPGKIAGTALTIGTSPILMPIAGYNKLISMGVENVGQKKRVHNLIPGWKGEKYKNPDPDGLEMLEDQRRIPTVWSYPTAGKALNTDGSIKDPEITAYMHKEPADLKTNPETSGHGFIGLRYSRYSAKKKRMERNELIYGFYPAGGFLSRISTGASQVLKSATVPGQLKDDHDHNYVVSRRYPAKAWQIAAIVKASENYADKGYNAIHRNCVSFVREMIGNKAHLDTGGDLFKEDEVRLGALENTLIGVGGLFQGYFDETSRSVVNNRARKKDLSYQGYGNMRVTAEDVRNYKGTQKFMNASKKGLTPSLVGERLFSTSKTSTGVLGSFNYAGNLGSDVYNAENTIDNISLDTLIDEISGESGDLMSAITNRLETLIGEDNESQQALGNIDDILAVAEQPLKELKTNLDRHKNKEGVLDKDNRIPALNDLQTAYEKLNKTAFDISHIYSKQLQADPQLDEKFTNILSLIELARRHINKMYEEMGSDTDEMSDLTGYRDRFSNVKIRVRSNDDDQIMITPSHYESYLQIYGSPEEAIKKYKRYKELKENEERTKEEDAEFDKLSLMEKTAEDFDKSHQYMLERENYSQQDLDYIFALKKRETKGMVRDQQKTIFKNGKSAAGIYQSLVMEKILGGMKEHYLSNPIHYKDKKSVEAWINNFVSQRMKMHPGILIMIIRAIIRNSINVSDDSIRQTVNDMIGQGYVSKVFADTSSNDNLSLASMHAKKAFLAFSEKTDTGYSEILNNAIQIARDMETAGAPLETLDDKAVMREQEKENEKKDPKPLSQESGKKSGSFQKLYDTRLTSSKKLSRTYNTAASNVLFQEMTHTFADDKGYLVYQGFQKDLRKLIEKTAGKDAANCSGSNTVRFLARACSMDGNVSSMLGIVLRQPWRTDSERKLLIKNYKNVIKAVEQRINKNTLRAIAKEMQLA